MVVFVFSFTIIIFFMMFFAITFSSFRYSTAGLLREVLQIQEFSNITSVYSISNLNILRADKKGENYLFGVKTDSTGFSTSNINFLHEYAKKSHISF